VHGGEILTQSASAPRAHAIAVAGGRIVAVGTDAELASVGGPGTRRVDLGGATVVPGLIDAHAHIWKIGHLLTTMVDLRRVRSLGELEGAVQRAARALPPGAWVLGRGYNEAQLAERRPPDRATLDRAAPDRPVVLTRTCGHIYALNSAALVRCGITSDTVAPSGGVIERGPDGEPTGLLHETAMGLVNAHLPPPTHDQHAAMITAALRHQLSLGITSTNDAGVAPALLAAYRAMDAERALPSRVNVMALRKVDGMGTVPLPEMSVSDHLRVDTVKFLADGGLSGATAALGVPYRDRDSTGVLRFTDAELLALAREAHDAGWRIATHAIGDVAIDQVLRTYEALGTGPTRHRIEHLGLPSQAQLERAARLGVIAVPQSVFLHELGRNFRACLPDAFLPRTYPLRDMLRAGLTIALSSDAPVVEDDSPFRGIQSAVDRLDGEGNAIAAGQAISAAEALYAYTMGGALASGDEANRGSLEVGKWADFVVLSASPLTTPTTGLSAIVADRTYLAGRLAFER
jgi:predicted amidohydrolase YtcJ